MMFWCCLTINGRQAFFHFDDPIERENFLDFETDKLTECKNYVLFETSNYDDFRAAKNSAQYDAGKHLHKASA